MPTYSPKTAEIERAWHVIDAEGMVLGRLATEVATLLRGKHKPTYTPGVDTGDFVVVTGAQAVRVTGKKEQKKYTSVMKKIITWNVLLLLLGVLGIRGLLVGLQGKGIATRLAGFRAAMKIATRILQR